MYVYETEPADVRRWLAIAAPGRLVLVDAQGDEVAAAAFAAALPADAPLSVVLDRLAAGGLSSTPAFAAASWDDAGLTVIVRGLAAAVVSSDVGTSTVAGERATTWVEQHHPDAESVTLRSDRPNPTGVRLPLAAGAVWTTSISATIDAAADAIDAARGPIGSSTEATAVSAPSAAEQLAAPPVAQPSTPAAEADAVPPEPVALPSVLDTQFFHDEDDDDSARAASADEPIDEGYDFLFGQTVLRPVGEAAVDDTEPEPTEPERPAAADPRSASPIPTPAPDAPLGRAADALGDHDGHTIFAEDLAALRARRASEESPTPDAAPQAPPLTFLELPGGTRQSLASPVVLGRAPTVSQVPASVVPTLVTLVGDDISRSHVRVAVEGGTVVVTDLHSRNGTQVVLPGQAPQSLRPGEPTPVIVGTVIDLGGDVTLRVREG